MIKAFLYPEFDCETCHGMAGYPCECAYHHAVAPGVGPSRLIRKLRRVYEWLTSPAWMNEPSVVAEWSRTMRGAPYLRPYEVVDYSGDTVEDLQTRIRALRSVANSTYGRFREPVRIDVRSWLEMAAMRNELLSRGVKSVV